MALPSWQGCHILFKISSEKIKDCGLDNNNVAINICKIKLHQMTTCNVKGSGCAFTSPENYHTVCSSLQSD